MTNYNAIAAAPIAAASLLNADIVVLGNPDSPPDNKATTLAQLAAKLNTIAQPSLSVSAGDGITGGTGTVFKAGIELIGNLRKLTIYIDLTGLASSTTDLDIIGVGASPAYLCQILAAEIGTVEAIRMTCLELPAGGADDIDLYAATEGTGVFDAGIGTLVETALITSGGAWASGTVKAATAVPAANQYLYLTGGEAGTAATYTAGKFLLEIFGY